MWNQIQLVCFAQTGSAIQSLRLAQAWRIPSSMPCLPLWCSSATTLGWEWWNSFCEQIRKSPMDTALHRTQGHAIHWIISRREARSTSVGRIWWISVDIMSSPVVFISRSSNLGVEAMMRSSFFVAFGSMKVLTTGGKKLQESLPFPDAIWRWDQHVFKLHNLRRVVGTDIGCLDAWNSSNTEGAQCHQPSLSTVKIKPAVWPQIVWQSPPVRAMQSSHNTNLILFMYLYWYVFMWKPSIDFHA